MCELLEIVPIICFENLKNEKDSVYTDFWNDLSPQLEEISSKIDEEKVVMNLQ